MKRKLQVFTLFVAMFIITMMGNKAQAQEQYIGNSTTINGASKYSLAINQEYYTTLSGAPGYVSFQTPNQEGYIVITYKNISMDGGVNCCIETAIGDELAYDYEWANGTSTFEFKCESGKKNNAKMDMNTRYYIHIGKDDDPSGNAKLQVQFVPDPNPNGKAEAEAIVWNTDYIRTIDANYEDDIDYYKFTAPSSGACRFTITNTDSGSSIDYEIRKWNSDELVKSLKNYDVRDYVYKNNTEEWDMSLEAGVTYYLKISGDEVGTYAFRISNERVQSITLQGNSVMNIGDYADLTAVVLPQNAYNKTIEYETSNDDIVTVRDSGRVHALAAGTAVITATATDGSGVKGQIAISVLPSKPYSPDVEKYSTSYVKISWYSVSNVTGYHIYCKNGNNWKNVGTTSGTTFTMKKLKAGTTYEFKVQAYIAGSSGELQSPMSETLKASTAPSKTKISSIKRTSKKKNGRYTIYSAKIKWKKVKGASRYKVYYKKSGSKFKELLGTYKGTSAKAYFYYYSGSKKYTFYVQPIRNVDGKEYTGGYSKGKGYTFK